MDSHFDVVCRSGDTYDYLEVEKNDVIDEVFNDLKIKVPYIVTKFGTSEVQH